MIQDTNVSTSQRFNVSICHGGRFMQCTLEFFADMSEDLFLRTGDPTRAHDGARTRAPFDGMLSENPQDRQAACDVCTNFAQPMTNVPDTCSRRYGNKSRI